MQQIANINDARKIKISTATSLHSKSWATVELGWGDFVRMFRTPKVTPETRAEFDAAPASRQLALKDAAGGYVGGAMIGVGRRTSDAISGRQLLCLDLDFAKAGFLEGLPLLFDWAFLAHTTRKHKTSSPKYRVLFPVDRVLNELEYLAISRRLGSWMGMDLLDHTTFQYERLMFWPTVSSDDAVHYACVVQDAAWVSADEVLATYVDHTDPREWPVHVKEAKLQKASLTKAGKPEEKPGVVGAFCRTYGIEEAFATFLGDIYEEDCGRWRYVAGSGGAGVYKVGEGDTGYAKSEHYSDPAAVGRPLCSWDFVRIHMFGALDGEKAGEDVPKAPSQAAMRGWALKQDGVREEMLAEDGFTALEALDVYGVAEEVGKPEDWQKKLTFTEDGNVEGTINNIVVILRGHPVFRGALKYNVFSGELDVCRKLPWYRTEGAPWEDMDTKQLKCFLEQKPFFIKKRDIIDAGVDIAALLSWYHPVRDYLDSLFWDGKKRIDTLLIDYFGAEDCEYTRMVTSRFLAAAVARIRQPGCKWDEVLSLVGSQGVGKSTFVRKLAQDEWFIDHLPDLTDKDSMAALRGKWIVELGEMATTRKADILRTKVYLANRVDDFRPAFGQRRVKQPRQCVFFGTTNEPDFLHDPTGNRRYWPVQAGVGKVTKSVWDDLTKYEIDQIWAEAIEVYDEGKFWYLDDHQRELAVAAQGKHTERDTDMGILEEWLEQEIPMDWAKYTPSMREQYTPGDELKSVRTRICVREVWNEALRNAGRPNPMEGKRIAGMLRQLPGWEETGKTHRFGPYGPQRYFQRL